VRDIVGAATIEQPSIPYAAVATDLYREAEPRLAAEWLNRMLRSTSALFDAAAARSLLDRPTARAVLNRFGASIPEIQEPGTQHTAVEQPVDCPEEAPEVPKLGSSSNVGIRHSPKRSSPTVPTRRALIGWRRRLWLRSKARLFCAASNDPPLRSTM
jgi:hypothetical protein